ncbi:Uncharacterised protein [Shewanella algae]|uniref:Uncharacterized protein n=1 Tax=Shewanella algae TaxID=38313 RepID=A0A379YS33_9GAMM|nr:Uncharacterised protein [Shewanella algae]
MKIQTVWQVQARLQTTFGVSIFLAQASAAKQSLFSYFCENAIGR